MAKMAVTTVDNPQLVIKLDKEGACNLQSLMQNIHPDYMNNPVLRNFAQDLFAMIADEFNEGNLG